MQRNIWKRTGAPRHRQPSPTTGAPNLLRLSLCRTQKGVLSRSELPEEECDGALTVLVLYCSATRSIIAHNVPKKGHDSQGYIVEMIRDDVLWPGHPKVMIRSDNEPALLQVVDTALAALKMKGVTSSSEGSMPYGPRPMGRRECRTTIEWIPTSKPFKL